MLQPKEISENVTVVVHLARLLMFKASRRSWTKLLFVASTGLFIAAGINGFITYLNSDYRNNSETQTAKYISLNDQREGQRTLDILDLCIDAEKNDSTNKQYYCQQAVALYEDTFKKLPSNSVAENIQRSAFGLMKVEIANKYRALSVDREVGPSLGMDDTLKFLISTTGIWFILVALAFFMGICFITIDRLSTQRSLNKTGSDTA